MEQNFFIDTENTLVSSNRAIYTPTVYARSSFLYLQEVGCLQAKKENESRRTGLDSYLFFIVVSGSGFLDYDKEKFELTAGDCVFINCAVPYAHSTVQEDLWSLEWIHFNGNTLHSIYEQYKSRGGKPVFRPADMFAFHDIYDSLFSVEKTTDYIIDLKINARLSELLALIMSESDKQKEIIGKQGKKIDMRPIKQYLDKNFRYKISLDELADRFFINKYYLIKSFKAQYGVSINSYLLEVRITKAKQMLRFTNQKVESIGKTCGLGALAYFSKTFKRMEGIGPKEYRDKWSETISGREDENE